MAKFDREGASPLRGAGVMFNGGAAIFGLDERGAIADVDEGEISEMDVGGGIGSGIGEAIGGSIGNGVVGPTELTAMSTKRKDRSHV